MLREGGKKHDDDDEKYTNFGSVFPLFSSHSSDFFTPSHRQTDRDRASKKQTELHPDRQSFTQTDRASHTNPGRNSSQKCFSRVIHFFAVGFFLRLCTVDDR